LARHSVLALPEPAAGDLFFDIEGARYFSADNKEFGLQYLFGIVDTADIDAQGAPRYTQFWAFDRAGEKRAFEELIDFITSRRARRPGLHVYHYNHYEPTAVDHLSELHETRQEAVGRLMGRYATREDEVDELFRFGRIVASHFSRSERRYGSTRATYNSGPGIVTVSCTRSPGSRSSGTGRRRRPHLRVARPSPRPHQNAEWR